MNTEVVLDKRFGPFAREMAVRADIDYLSQRISEQTNKHLNPKDLVTVVESLGQHPNKKMRGGSYSLD